MRRLWYGCGAAGIALVGAGIAAVLVQGGTAVRADRVGHRLRVPVAHARSARRELPRLTGTITFRRHRKPPKSYATPISSVSPSLYERTTSPLILRAQGCRQGRQYTSGLVVLDFGMLAYRPSLGYGTITFADRFASNTAVGWAVKAYARGYSECLPKTAAAHITLALGTSNYNQDVPSTYEAGKEWAAAVSSIARYLEVHHFEHVVAAAGDDVEPAWDRGFQRTYDFFRGFRDARSGALIYNYGSLDGGVVKGIWKLRQAYYVAGGMAAARAVPEIYNGAMASEWAEFAHLSATRYGKPIKLVGLMTQHRANCRVCGFTAAQAHAALAHELAKRKARVERMLATATNIGAPAPVSQRDLRLH